MVAPLEPLAMDEDLAQFVARAHERGMDLDNLTGLLTAQGWGAQEVAAAWCARVLERPVPAPAGGPRAAGGHAPVSPRETFWHMLGFCALYTWVISLIVLAFEYVNLALPDATEGESGYAHAYTVSGIRWSLATIVVAFPFFLWVWRVVLRDLAAHPEQARGVARRWLTYLSLFVGAATLLGDVITLVYFVFDGELTARFLLKVVALFVITGGVFLYLVATLRPAPATASPKAAA